MAEFNPEKISLYDNADVIIESLLEHLRRDQIEYSPEIISDQLHKIAYGNMTRDLRDIWLIDTLGMMLGLGKIYEHAITDSFVMILSTPLFVSEIGFAFCLSFPLESAPTRFLPELARVRPVPQSVNFNSK